MRHVHGLMVDRGEDTLGQRTPTVKGDAYSPQLKLINAGAWAGMKVGLPIGKLDAASIVLAAQRSTGLQDYGDDAFLSGLDQLIACVADAPITSFARVMLRQTWMRAVKNRLWTVDYLKKHREVLDTKVERPIFVLGFPRTGTTLLQNLLSLDPRRRALQFWELTSPVPSVADPLEDRRRRIAWISRQLSVAYTFAPEMGKVHYISPTTYEECWPLFANAFAVFNFDLQSGRSQYGDYLLHEHDMVQAYGEYRQALQMLVHQQPADQLVLKCPEHLWFVDDLLENFPDACIVWTHRDPFDAVASYCSLISMQWRTLYGKFDPKDTGRHISSRFLEGIERAMASRERHDSSRFYDVSFASLVRDPVGTVRDIESYFGLNHHGETDDAVRAYLARKREDSRGSHVYSAERYGLDRDEINRRYAGYIDALPSDTLQRVPRAG